RVRPGDTRGGKRGGSGDDPVGVRHFLLCRRSSWCGVAHRRTNRRSLCRGCGPDLAARLHDLGRVAAHCRRVDAPSPAPGRTFDEDGAMKAAIYNGPHAIELGERPDPTIQEPSDAVVRVVLGCVCGSDLWYYRGDSPHALGPIGHEFIGVIEEVGAEVRGIGVGELVIAPFTYSDGTCAHCRAGWTSNCAAGGGFGNHGLDG